MKTNKQILYVFTAVIAMASMLFGAVGIRPASAATVLGAGDIAIVGFSYHPTNDFAFVLLVDVEAGTQISFTDAGWTEDNEFFSGEGAVRFTASGDLPAGTVISYQGNTVDFEVIVEGPFSSTGGIAFTTSGDQLLAFQGSYDSPDFLYALNNDSNGWTPGTMNAQTTYLPPGLVDGYTAISLGGTMRNGVYTGSLSGTREELLAAISDPDNWYYTNGGVTMPTTPFTVDPGYPEVVSTTPAANAVNVLRYDPVIIQFDEDVDLEDGWFEIDCTVSGAHLATVSGGAYEYTLEPDEPFVLDDVCTVTVAAEMVTDYDDTPKNMQEDYEWSFSVLRSEDLNINFSSNSPVVVGELAVFTNTTTGEGEITYEWDFGDGSGTSMDTSPSYHFAARGTYPVTLTATNVFGEDTLTQEFVVLPMPFITVDKVVDLETDVPLGGTVTYTVTIENTGEEIAEGVELSDSLPEGVSYIEQLEGPDLVAAGNDLSWTDDIGAGASVVFRFSAEVEDDAALYGQTITNTAYVSSAIAGSDASAAAFTVQPEPLVASFTSNSPVVLGESAFFTNTTTGAGPISYVWDFGDGSAASMETNPEHVYTATGGYTVTLTATNPSGDASVSASFVVLTEPVITLDKAVTFMPSILPGDLMSYIITIENTGEGLARDVQLTDTLPAGVTYTDQFNGPNLTVTGNELSWTGDVAGGGSLEFGIRVQVDDDPFLYNTTITNTAFVESLDAGGDESSASFTIDPSPASVAISKEVSTEGAVALGEEVTYTITLTNSGQTDAVGVTMEDVLPAGLRIGALVGESQGEIDTASNTLSWTGNVPSDGEVVITFTAILDEDTELYGTKIENTAAFNWEDGSGSDTASFMVELSPAVVTISKSVTPDVDVALGGTVTYTITMTNLGDTEATGVGMSDVLPVSMTVLSVQGGGAVSGNTVSWTGSIAGNSSKVIVFTASLSDSLDLFGQSVSNTVTFTSANAGQGQASASFQVIEMPKIYFPVILTN